MAAGPFIPILLRRPVRLVLAMLVLAAGAFIVRLWLAVGDGVHQLEKPGNRPWLLVFERYHTGQGSSLPRDLVLDLQRTTGVAAAIPEVWTRTVASDPTDTVRVRGIDPRDRLAIGAVTERADGTIREWLHRVRQGRAPPRASSSRSPAACVLGRRLAQRFGKNKGDQLVLSLESGAVIVAEVVEVSDVGPREYQSTVFVEPEPLPGSHGTTIGGTCTCIRVLPMAGTDLRQLAGAIERAFARYRPLRAIPGDAWMAGELATGTGLLRVWRIVAVVAFLACLAGWALALWITLAPRVTDIAVLQLVGSNAQALSQRLSLGSMLAVAVSGLTGSVLAVRLILREMPVLVSGTITIDMPIYPESTLLVVGMTALGAAGVAWWPARRLNRAAARLLATS